MQSLLRGWWMFAVGVGGAIVFFICGVVLGVFLGVVPMFSTDHVAFPYASLWMWALTGLAVSVAVLLAWLTGCAASRRARRVGGAAQ